MIRCIATLLVVFFLSAVASAQVVYPPIGPGSVVPLGPGVTGAVTPAGYQGPGDITSGAIAFYSVGRAYNAAYAAAQSPLADIVDTATGLATCTIKVGTNGFANLTATVCPTSAPTVNIVTFCTVMHVGCSITKLYDQTGNGNDVVQSGTNGPTLAFNAQNGLPCAAGNGNGINIKTVGNVVQAAPFTRMAVVERTGNVTTRQDIIDSVSPTRLAFTNSANSVTINNGATVSLSATDSAFHALIAVASGTAPLFAVDSSVTISTSSNGTTSLSGPLSVMNSVAAGQPLTNGFMCEAGIWPADLNSSYQVMLANMRSAIYGWNF